MNKTFNELRRIARSVRGEKPEVRVAVAGDCATQHLSSAIYGALAALGMAAEVFDADYDQLDALTLDSGSELFSFQPDYVVLHLCTERLYGRFREAPAAERRKFAASEVARLRELWDRIEASSAATVFTLDFPEIDDGVFGGYALSLPGSFVSQVRRLNVALIDAAASDRRLGIVGASGVQREMGAAFSDPKLYYTSKMPMGLEAIAAVACRVADSIAARRGRVRKCLVTDLDGTLWGGVVGDDGVSGIRVGELGDGPAFSDYQAWLRELEGRGVILAVCSKNQADIAREPFAENPEMLLGLDDFALFVANWDDKATNIRRIQEMLNIGMDSIVFIDDNRFERELVRGALPEVAVPEIPDDPSLRVSFLRSENLFEVASYSEEDAARTGQYIAEGRRRESAARFDTLDEYLESLGMVGTAAPFDEYHMPRIAQLTQRSNQFNLRTVRYSEAEVTDFAARRDAVTLYFTLSDRFGDHGLVSLMIGLPREGGDELFIDTWVMSCRVLKRGMEEFCMNELVARARERGFKRIVGEYLPTRKNAMVADIYPKMGFIDGGDGTFVLDVDAYEEKKTHIKEENND